MDINIGFSSRVVYSFYTNKKIWFPLFIKSLFAVLNKQESTDNVHFRTTGNLSGFRSIDSFRYWLQRKQKKATVYLEANLNNKQDEAATRSRKLSDKKGKPISFPLVLHSTI